MPCLDLKRCDSAADKKEGVKTVPKGYRDAMRTITPEEVIEMVLEKT